MPKPLRRSALLVAMVLALCAMVAVACHWRALMAQTYRVRLRSDAAFAREVLGSDLDGWRMDELRLYLQTHAGGKMLCAELLRSVISESSHLPGGSVPPKAAIVSVTQDIMHVRQADGWPICGARVSGSDQDRARLKTLFSRTLLVHAGVSFTDAATGITLTIDPASEREDMRIQIRRLTTDKGEN
jgi:hypothetical protein